MERFFNKINKTNKCWEWTAAKTNGYGTFKLEGKTIGAHIVSYKIHKGEIKKDYMYVIHVIIQVV